MPSRQRPLQPASNDPRQAGRAVQASERRGRIIAAALAEFSDKGFAAARMEDIARRADVAKGTLYLHFADKQALFAGIISESITPAIEPLLGHGPEAGETVRAYLLRMAPAIASRLVEQPRADVIRLLVAEGSRFPDLAEMYFRQVVSRAMGQVRALAVQAQANGEVDSDVLARLPQLLAGPMVIGVLWAGLFGRIEPLDAPGLIRAQIDLLFPEKKAGPP